MSEEGAMETIIRETDEYTVVRTDYDGGFMDEVRPKPGSDLERQLQDEQEQIAAGTRAHAAYIDLKSWAEDEASLVAAWDTITNVQKDAAHRRLHGRFGKLADGLADLLRSLR